MKNILTIVLLAFTFALNASSNPNLRHLPTCFGKATLSAGTMIMLESTEQIKTGQATVGQLVYFRVKTNVKAEGDVVISTGAMGLGRIKSIDKASYNNPETFHIEVTSVQAVDGQMVPLNGQELMLKGKYSSQEATADAGRTITAFVTNDIKIKT